MLSHSKLATAVFVVLLSWPDVGRCYGDDWPEAGSYAFSNWNGPTVQVHFSVPLMATAESPVLIVVPGAKRNADEYRDQWHDLAKANGFIVLTLGASVEDFPTERDYNGGGVISEEGELQPRDVWLFSAIEPLFDHFVARYGSKRKSYSLYGHSAGGGFVHRYLLFVPEARVDHAVAANPAFFSMPNWDAKYPFALDGTELNPADVHRWFGKPLTLLLGEQDTGPRTKPLSNGPQAQQQGPSVYARGLGFFKAALERATSDQVPFRWRLEVVHRVGHSNTHMASHAVRFLGVAE